LNKARDITEGSVLYNILYMGIPSMVGFSAMTIYSLINIFWVGRLGTPEVAAITLVGAVLWVFSSFNQIVGTGSVALIARRFGEKKYDETAKVIKQTMILKVALPMLFIYPLYFFLDKLLIMMDADPTVLKYGLDYGKIIILGQPAIFLAFTIYTALRGIGEAPKSMFLMVFSTTLNFVLDPIMMFDSIFGYKIGFGMGIKGVAYATIIASMFSNIIGIFMFCANRVNLDFNWKKDWLFQYKTMFGILNIGLPSGVENFMRSSAAWIEMLFIASFGSITVASFGFSRRILELSIMFSTGMNMGNSAIVGQCLGAEKPDRAEKSSTTATKTIFLFQTLLSLVEILFAKHIISLFSNDPKVIGVGSVILSIMCLFQPFVGAQIVLGSSFKGAGNTFPPLVITTISYWLLELPSVFIMIKIFHLGANYIWYSIVAAQVITFFNMYVWFRRGNWKLKKV
jgi:putative MATE family efflux protein